MNRNLYSPFLPLWCSAVCSLCSSFFQSPFDCSFQPPAFNHWIDIHRTEWQYRDTHRRRMPKNQSNNRTKHTVKWMGLATNAQHIASVSVLERRIISYSLYSAKRWLSLKECIGAEILCRSLFTIHYSPHAFFSLSWMHH